jgi:hypothetical protein
MHPHAITVAMGSDLLGGRSSFGVSFMTALEMIHIFGMVKWESTAPAPGTVGLRGGSSLENSQQARLQFLLENVGVPNPAQAYSTLALKTRNHKGNGDSKVTTKKPAQGLPLLGSWYLDACLSLPQKLEIVDALRHLDYSARFVAIARKFVAGQPISEVA